MTWRDKNELDRQIAIRKVLAFNAESTMEFAWHAQHALKLAEEKRRLEEKEDE